MAQALKLGAATYTYLFACSQEEAIRRLADLGFHYFELTANPPHPAAADLDSAARRRLAQLCASLDLCPVAVQTTFTDVNLAAGHEAIRQASIQVTRECIQLAADLGAPYVPVVSGRVSPLIAPPLEASLARAANSLEACLPLAERLGVTLVLECVPYCITPDAALLLRLVERLNHPNVKVLLDAANNHMVESPAEALKAVQPHLALVHLSDTKRSHWLHAEIGQGEVDFAAVARTLQEIGYEGTTILETTIVEGPDEAMRRSKAALERLGWSAWPQDEDSKGMS